CSSWLTTHWFQFRRGFRCSMAKGSSFYLAASAGEVFIRNTIPCNSKRTTRKTVVLLPFLFACSSAISAGVGSSYVASRNVDRRPDHREPELDLQRRSVVPPGTLGKVATSGWGDSPGFPNK